MPRKKEPVYETEQYAFPSRLRELMKERGIKQKELAMALGVKPQTVSLYTQGQSFPDVNKLYGIARYFNVSADWLIGIPDSSKTVNANVTAVIQYTGLSEKAIYRIVEETALYPGFTIYEDDIDLLSVLNLLLTSTRFWGLLNQLRGYINSPKRIESRSAETARELHEVIHGANMDDKPNERDVFGYRSMRAFNSLLEELDTNESGVENYGKR